MLRLVRAGEGEEEGRDGQEVCQLKGDAARHQTADLARGGGSGGYDADPVAQGVADSDGMAGQPHA